jgi:hypothetical protein
LIFLSKEEAGDAAAADFGVFKENKSIKEDK